MNAAAPISRSKTTVNTYIEILRSFAHGHIRLLNAEIGVIKLTNALLNFRTKPRGSFEGNEFEGVLTTIASIRHPSYVAMDYVTTLSYLVYATSILDSFLTDTATFLFLLVPEAMGKEHQVPLRTLISAESRNAAIQQIAATRARELSFKTFADRLQFFRDKFGMPMAVAEEDIQKLVHYTDVRNSAVHDQGMLEFGLNRFGAITSRLKTCPVHPTKLSGKESDEALRVYGLIASQIAYEVLTHVLKVKNVPKDNPLALLDGVASSQKAPARKRKPRSTPQS